MATLQGKAVKNTYRQVLQIGANNVGVSGSLQPVQDGGGVNTSLSLSTTAATITGTLTINGDLIITGGGIQIQDLIDDTVASLIQNGTGITWAYNDTLRTLTPTITIATADGGVQGDFVQYNTGAGEANAVAKMYWNTTDGTVDLGLMGGNVVLPIGQKQVARVLNNSGSILNKSAYQVVKITAAQGQRLAVGLAQANNDANSTDTIGLVAENIANNQEGFVTSSGLITGVDTTGDLQLEDWNDGDILYLSPTTPGAITKVKPVAPQHTVIVGFVVYAHKNNGKIYVKVDNGYELDELHNVKITSVANDNILQYNSSLAVWENVAGTTTNIAEGTNLYYTQGRFDSAFAAKSTTNLAEGTNLYFTTARGDANFATNFATKDTDDLPEGSTNLYYTNARTRNALSVTAGTGIAYNSTTGNFNLGSIPNASLTNSSVTINGLSLALGASISLTTTDIAEGTNLYWTDARFDSRFGTKTTTNLAEGTNLYYTQARFNTAFDAKTTTDLDEGTNLYYTDARSRAAFSENAVGLDYSSGSGILSLTAGYAIPTTVKLGQYDTAYNRSIVSAAVTGTSTKTLSLTQQDANVITASWTDQGITTINGTANQIAASTVGNTTTVGFTNDVTFPNNVVVSGNLTINGTATYVNTQSISSKDPLFEVANDNNTTDAVDIGYYGRYYDSAQTRVEFTGLFRDASDAGKFKFFTGLVDEPTNVVDTTGTGYTVGTLVANVEGNLAGTANAANVLSTARTISATGDAAWSVSFDGSANATAALTLANTGVTATTYGTTTAVPTIAVDSKGRITSASNTNIAFPVTTVNGASGTVVLTTSNVAEGSNQYFTSARAQASITGGASSVVTADLTASRALVSDGSGKIAASASTTATEIGYVAGVTSAIQTQLNGKLNLSGGTLTGGLSGTTGTFSGILTTPQVKAATSAGLSINANSGTQVADFGAGGSANITFFGGLSGTSATFSDNVTITNSARPYLITKTTTATEEAGIKIQQTTVSDWYVGVAQGTPSSNDFAIRDVKNSRIPFYLSASTGAATFSSSVTANVIHSSNGVDYDNGNFTGFYIGGSNTSNARTASIIKNTSGDYDLIIRSQNATSVTTGSLIFQNGSTEQMRITSSGNVGIGTSSPSARLAVHKSQSGTSASASGVLRLENTGANYTSTLILTDGNTNDALISYLGATQSLGFGIGSTANQMVITSGGRVGIGQTAPGIALSVAGQSEAWQFGVTTASGTAGALIGSPSANVLAFGDWSGSERMRITSGGDAGIGKTGSVTGLDVYFSNTDTINARSGQAAGPSRSLYTGWHSASATTSGTLAFNVTTNGNVTNANGSYGAFSDIKLKENITDATPKLDDLLKVKIRNYNLIGEQTKQLGVIAQELEEIFPSMVDEHEDFEEVEVINEEGNITKETQSLGTITKSVKYSVFTIMNTKAIQEIVVRYDSKIQLLEAQIEELKALIAAK